MLKLGAQETAEEGERSVTRQTGEGDPYDMSIAPLNIYNIF